MEMGSDKKMYKISFGDDGEVLKLHCEDSCTTV